MRSRSNFVVNGAKRDAAKGSDRGDGPVVMCRRCSRRHRRRAECSGLRVYLLPGSPQRYPNEIGL